MAGWLVGCCQCCCYVYTHSKTVGATTAGTTIFLYCHLQEVCKTNQGSKFKHSETCSLSIEWLPQVNKFIKEYHILFVQASPKLSSALSCTSRVILISCNVHLGLPLYSWRCGSLMFMFYTHSMVNRIIRSWLNIFRSQVGTQYLVECVVVLLQWTGSVWWKQTPVTGKPAMGAQSHAYVMHQQDNKL